MFQIDVMSRIPVYEQIINQTEKFILTGILPEGDKFPSVRSLSMELSVNPNTIQKAVTELDRRGLIYSVPGKGCFVSDKAKKALQASMRESLTDFSARIRELAQGGVSREEILSCVNKVFDEEGK
ncbi:MAG: GntR family transcriptional regulator [Lachnospiraceae bacterium]